MNYYIKDWKEYQHYKVRTPPWIKLHKKLLDDPEFHKLSGDASKTLVMCWLIASETAGYLPDITKLAFRLRIDINVLAEHLIELNHWIKKDDSVMLADRLQDACVEKEEEEEKEKERKNKPPNPLFSNQANPPPDFSEFWQSYPRHHGSPDMAAKAYELARRQGATHQQIMRGANLYAALIRQNATETKYVTSADKWLKEKKWTVDYQVKPAYTPMHPGAGG